MTFTPRESDIEKKLVRWARERGYYTRKFVSPSASGVPDRIFAANGRIIFLELKRPGNKPTALQLREIDLLNKAGLQATWSDSFQGAVEIIDDALTPDCV